MMRKSKMLSVALATALMLAACGGEADDTTTTAGEGTTTTGVTSSTEGPTTSTTGADTTTTGGGSEASADLAALQAAMALTAEAAPSRVEGVIRLVGVPDVPVAEVEMPFSVVTDPATGDSSMTMDFAAMAAIGGEEIPPEMAEMIGSMEVREIGDTVYMRFPFFTAFLGAATEWVSMPSDQDSMADDMTPGAAPSDPGRFLETLQDAEGESEALGTEDVRGIATTHYRIIIDEEWAANLGDEERAALEEQGFQPDASFPLELWVADDGLVHRMALTADSSQLDETEEFESMTMTFDFYDFGQSVTIEPPPPDQVTPLDELSGPLGTLAP